jgi:hypothetical protein
VDKIESLSKIKGLWQDAPLYLLKLARRKIGKFLSPFSIAMIAQAMGVGNLFLSRTFPKDSSYLEEEIRFMECPKEAWRRTRGRAAKDL